MNNPLKTKNSRFDDQVNKYIRAKEMLVIMPDGEKRGPLQKRDALALASEYSLDLLIVADNINPPVAKLLDYGKYKYEQKKKEHESKKHQHVIENKEIRLRTGIGDHDIKFKADKVREFLLAGDRVKISLKFRGREAAHPEFGQETLNKFFSYIEDIAKIDKEAKLTGMFLDMYVVPKK